MVLHLVVLLVELPVSYNKMDKQARQIDEFYQELR
jgi:hypothetical protein